MRRKTAPKSSLTQRVLGGKYRRQWRLLSRKFMNDPGGHERWCIVRILDERLRIASPREDVRNLAKGGLRDGPSEWLGRDVR